MNELQFILQGKVIAQVEQHLKKKYYRPLTRKQYFQFVRNAIADIRHNHSKHKSIQ